jgi:hypothetical protein
MHHSIVALAVSLAVAAAAPACADESAPELVARVIAAYGGRAALERALVVSQEGTVTSTMHPEPGRVVRLFQQPDSLRVAVEYPRGPTEVRVVHAGRGDRDGVEVTGTPMHWAMVLQAARLALPLSLARRGAAVTTRPVVERDGKRLRVLALPLPDAIEMVVEIDPVSHRIVRSSGSMPAPAGGGRIEFATEYSDFRKVSGVLFPFHEENYARGQHTGATTLTKVEVAASAVAEDAFGQRL